MVILSGFYVLNFVIIVSVFGDCFGCLSWKKKMFSYNLVLTPYKLIFMLSEFAHPTCFIQCLISAIMISFLGFHFFPLDRYDMKEILQVKDSAVLQVTVIKPLHFKKKKKKHEI